MMAKAMPGWKVDNQVETVGLGPDGRAVDGLKVFFHTESGVNASVFVPKARYNANAVQAAIAEYLTHIAAVSDLSG